MATSTDPAREIADFCKRLAQGSSKTGDQHLADLFGVRAWSREYLEILSSFMERTDFLIQIVPGLHLDDDQRKEIEDHIKALQRLCGKDVLVRRWDDASGGLPLVKSTHTAAVNALSGLVRQQVKYPKLDDAEIADVVGQIDQLLTWLETHQLSEQDFIRHALIEGLKTFRIRLERIGWLGWDCAHEGLREVVAAYMALERGFPASDANPDAAAVLKKTGGLLKLLWNKAGQAREGMDRIDVFVRLYGLGAMARDTGIAGLLTSGS